MTVDGSGEEYPVFRFRMSGQDFELDGDPAKMMGPEVILLEQTTRGTVSEWAERIVALVPDRHRPAAHGLFREAAGQPECGVGALHPDGGAVHDQPDPGRGPGRGAEGLVAEAGAA